MKIECLECGSPAETASRRARFCCPACKMKWNNRRRDRGAELYDLLMAHNYDRKEARPLDTWSQVFRLMTAYRDADRAIRKGRKSWRPVKEAIASLPLAYGAEGDSR